MKKRITVLMAVVLLLSVLTGCACKHEWKDAACLTPKTCTLCEETEGEPAGHKWEEATCEAPKTCSVCAVTEGQPLPHSEATRYHSIDYVTCSAQHQVYCSNCVQLLAEEKVILDTLYDGSGFFFDSEGFLERYTAVASKTEFMYCDFAVNEEEMTADVLTLEYTGSHIGQMAIIGGEDYSIRVRFTFYGLDGNAVEEALPRCTRIGVSVLSATIGDPNAGIAIPEGDAAKANNVMLNFLIWRNICVTLMTCDPSLESKYPDSALMNLMLSLLDSGEDGTLLNNSAVHNNIRYGFNEDGELVIELVS